MSARMKRREFITLLCGAAAAWPRASHAQQSSNLPRVGSIHTTRSENSEAFFQGLREAGYADGQNVLLESRFSEGEPRAVRTSQPRSTARGLCEVRARASD